MNTLKSLRRLVITRPLRSQLVSLNSSVPDIEERLRTYLCG
jgi:hypothetical protein